MPGPGSYAWFARHELRLFWRDWVYLLTAGRANRLTVLIIALGIFVGLMHLLALAIIMPLSAAGIAVDKPTLVIVTGGLFLATTTMISQAMDSVTRAFYSRGDLDLILSSPVPPNRIFAVRMVAIALTTTVLSVAIAGPFINALAIFAGARWLAAYRDWGDD